MRFFPDTRSKEPSRRWPELVLLAIGVLAVVLLLLAFFSEQDFSPGEEVRSENVEQIAASLEDTIYPPRDILLFEGGPEVVYVYLAVRGLEPDSEIGASVNRVGHGSPLSRVFGSGGGLRIVEGREEQLAPADEGLTGVVKFEVRGEGGGTLPGGNYTVEVRINDTVAASKRFVIQD